MATKKSKIEKDVLRDYSLDLDKEIPPILNPFGFYPDEGLILEGLWLPYSTDKGNVKALPSVIIGTNHYDGDKTYFVDFETKMLYDVEQINGFEIKGNFPERDFNLATKKIVSKLIKNKTDVSIKKVSSECCKIFKKYVWFEEHDPQLILGKYWALGTYFYDVFDAYPILNINGVSESGKSRLLLLIMCLAYHGYNTLNPTEAGIFRDKEELKPTMCIDEEEYLRSRERRSTVGTLINASYSKDGGWVTRHDESSGGKRVRKRFYLFSPLAISGILGLPGVTKSRVVQIIMQRADKNYPKPHINDFIEFRDDLYLLRLTKSFEIYTLYHSIDLKGVVSRRFDELFRPIFTICKYFGSSKEWDALVKLANDYENDFRAEALNVSDEEQVLNCLEEMIREKEKTESYHLKDLAEKVNTKFNRSLSSNSISDVLRRLNFKERKRHGDGTVFLADMERVAVQKARIGLIDVEGSVSVSASLNSQSSQSSLAYEVSEVSEESEACEEGKKFTKKGKIDQVFDIKKLKKYVKKQKKLDKKKCFEWDEALNDFIKKDLGKEDPEFWINKQIEMKTLDEPILGKLRFLVDFEGENQ